MKADERYIIPKNYNVKSKFLGMIEYSSLFYLVTFNISMYFLLKLIITSVIIKLQILILLSTPVILFLFIGINGENVNYVIYYMLRYFFKEKVHLYNK